MHLALCSCMICGRRITPNCKVCRFCGAEYGLSGPMGEWPAWARCLWADHQAERRHELNQMANEEDLERARRTNEVASYGEFNRDQC